MRYLIVSDVHGNRFGLEAVLQDTRDAWDKVICLGDVVGYGAHPNECCEMLRSVDAMVLLGNHDAAALGWLNTDYWNDVARSAMAWTRDRLSKENWVWLNKLEPQRVITSDDFHFYITHGNLQEPFYEEYILNEVDTWTSFEAMTHSVCFFGHTHTAGYFRSNAPFSFENAVDTVRLPYGGLIQLSDAYKYLVNPGSCGQPRDGNPQARYAVFNDETATIEIKGVDYDVEAARIAIYEGGLSSILGDRLIEAW